MDNLDSVNILICVKNSSRIVLPLIKKLDEICTDCGIFVAGLTYVPKSLKEDCKNHICSNVNFLDGQVPTLLDLEETIMIDIWDRKRSEVIFADVLDLPLLGYIRVDLIDPFKTGVDLVDIPTNEGKGAYYTFTEDSYPDFPCKLASARYSFQVIGLNPLFTEGPEAPTCKNIYDFLWDMKGKTDPMAHHLRLTFDGVKVPYSHIDDILDDIVLIANHREDIPEDKYIIGELKQIDTKWVVTTISKILDEKAVPCVETGITMIADSTKFNQQRKRFVSKKDSIQQFEFPFEINYIEGTIRKYLKSCTSL